MSRYVGPFTDTGYPGRFPGQVPLERRPRGPWDPELAGETEPHHPPRERESLKLFDRHDEVRGTHLTALFHPSEPSTGYTNLTAHWEQAAPCEVGTELTELHHARTFAPWGRAD